MKIHYKLSEGLIVRNKSRNWLCFTLITPNGKTSTLGIDEDEVNCAYSQCSGQEQEVNVTNEIITKITASINGGCNFGAIEVLT